MLHERKRNRLEICKKKIIFFPHPNLMTEWLCLSYRGLKMIAVLHMASQTQF